MADTRIQLRPGADLAEWLRERAALTREGQRRSIDMQAKEDLGLLRDLLGAELRRIRLTLAQANCLADILSSPVLDSAVGTGLGLAYAECYDAFRLARSGPGGTISSYGAKWAPEGADPVRWERDLLDLLGALGPAADYALREAIARWWADVHPRDSLQWRDPDHAGDFRADSPEGYALAGLRVVT